MTYEGSITRHVHTTTLKTRVRQTQSLERKHVTKTIAVRNRTQVASLKKFAWQMVLSDNWRDANDVHSYIIVLMIISLRTSESCI